MLAVKFVSIPRGPAYMLASATLFAMLGLLIKILGPQYRLWDIATYRLLGGTILLLALFGRHQNLFKPSHPKLFLLRGITGSIAFLSLIIALRTIPFATTMVYFYSYPAFAAIFAPLLFGERITLYEVFCLVVALIGVGVLFDLQMDASLTGQIMAILSGLFAGLTVAIIKKLRASNGSVIIYFYFCLVGSIICLGPFLSNPRMPDNTLDIIIVAGILITSITAQLLMNQGFSYCKSWEGGLYMTSEVIVTTLIGLLFLSEATSWRFWVGGLLIIGSAMAFQLGKKHAT